MCPDSIKEQRPHHACPYCRGSFYAKLCFVSRHDTENLFIAEIQQFLRVVNADAEVLRLAVCKLHPAKYGRVEDVMTASLSSRTQQVWLVTLQSWTQRWSQPQREQSCLGWCTRRRLAWRDHALKMQVHEGGHAATHHIRHSTSVSTL